MLMKAMVLYCKRCNLTFGDDQLDENGEVRCPQCKDLIRNIDTVVVRTCKDKCRCLNCEIAFSIVSSEATPEICPSCGNLAENKHRESNLGRKPRPIWQSSTSDKEIRERVKLFADQNICYGKDKIIGFPGTTPEPISVEIYNRYVNRHSNNIGMHTNKKTGNCEMGFNGTQDAEREVIAMATDLMDAYPHEIDGYIASGGTEANLVGCWMGRNANQQESSAIICSFLTHYSIVKASNVLGIGTFANESGKGLHLIGTDNGGHILLAKFKEKLNELANKGISNIIVVGNAGTTMLGSVDDIPSMNRIIGETKDAHPAVNIHFHVDAAFGGFVVPFIEGLPKIGFSNNHVGSVTIDVHKMGLAPYGSGIILARHGLFERVKSSAPYIPGNDCTLCGSRSGAIALSCWAAMRKIGKSGYEKSARHLTSLTSDIRLKLENAGLDTFPNDINIVAVKGKMPETLRDTYITHIHENFPTDLSSPFRPERSTIWNVVVMKHTTIDVIDELISQLKC